MTPEQLGGLLIAAANRDELAIGALTDYMKELGHEEAAEMMKAALLIHKTMQRDHKEAVEFIMEYGVEFDHDTWTCQTQEMRNIASTYLDELGLPTTIEDACSVCGYMFEDCTCPICGECAGVQIVNRLEDPRKICFCPMRPEDDK
jgi:rubrerythrin